MNSFNRPGADWWLKCYVTQLCNTRFHTGDIYWWHNVIISEKHKQRAEGLGGEERLLGKTFKLHLDSARQAKGGSILQAAKNDLRPVGFMCEFYQTWRKDRISVLFKKFQKMEKV